MKKMSRIILIFLMIGQSEMIGQTAFLDSTFTWSEVIFIGHNGESFTAKYKFDSIPTLYNGKAYFEILRSGSENGETWENISKFIRNDGAKIYQGFPTREELIIDYDLAVKDVFALPFGNELTVTAIDSINLENGTKRKRLELNCDLWGDLPIYWIEGVGSSPGLANYELTCVTDIGTDFLCLWHNDTLLYHNPDYDTCWLTIVSTVDFEKNNISFFPNPMKDRFIIEDPDLIMTHLLIYDIRGQLLYAGEEHEVMTNDFPAGMYILSIKLKNGLRISERLLK